MLGINLCMNRERKKIYADFSSHSRISFIFYEREIQFSVQFWMCVLHKSNPPGCSTKYWIINTQLSFEYFTISIDSRHSHRRSPKCRDTCRMFLKSSLKREKLSSALSQASNVLNCSHLMSNERKRSSYIFQGLSHRPSSLYTLDSIFYIIL